LTVPSNVMLTFTWQVRNAMTFRIRRISPDGPPVDITDPPGNSLDFGPFTERRPLDAVYELSATNTCSTVSRNVYVHLRENPTLKILGIELIQVIQRFNLSSPSQNNSVRLRDRKRTIARLYIDSGISNGFDNGFGPNNQPFVTGSVAVFQQMAGRSFDAGPPLNVGGTVVAQPPNNIDRNDITHTLNFELPMQQLVGNIRIEAKVWVRDHESDVGSGWHGQFTYTGIHFHLSGRQILVRILVRDNHHLLSPAIKNPPDVLEYNISLRGARARMPISEDGFVIHLAPGFETINCNHDLRTKKGWNDLLDDIDDIAGEFEDLGQIWTAISANDRPGSTAINICS
jgi:hypothetical protein